MRQSSDTVFIMISICYRFKIQSSKDLFHAVSLCLTIASQDTKTFCNTGFWGLEGGWDLKERQFGRQRQRCKDFMEIRMVGCGLKSLADLCDHYNEIFGFIKCGKILC